MAITISKTARIYNYDDTSESALLRLANPTTEIFYKGTDGNYVAQNYHGTADPGIGGGNILALKDFAEAELVSSSDTDERYKYTWKLSADGKCTITLDIQTVIGTDDDGTHNYWWNIAFYMYYNGSEFAETNFGGAYGGNATVEEPVIRLSFINGVNSEASQTIRSGFIYTRYPITADDGSTTTYNNAFVLSPLFYGGATGWDKFFGNASVSDEYDPYNPDADGQSGTGGGEGDFDDTSDTIDIPDVPSISVTDTGFVGLFTPTLAQLKSLANYMWSDLFSVDSFKKIFADPMDCILGLSIVPVAVPTSTTGTVNVGNISTGVTMNVASSQYVSVDCGTLNINEYWGSFLDYAPHTKAQIYLPYVGVRQIDTDEIMGRAVRIVYHVDILTGACICFITSGGSVLYTFEGACASSIPITGSNFTEMINTIVSIAGAAVATAATGGAAAPTVAAAAGQTATKVTAQIGLSTATNISNMKPTIEHSGSVAGAGALLAVQKPYLIAHRPNQCLPGNQNTFSGYPSYITATLGAQSGFTQVEYINLSGLSATEAESEEIERELKSGVII